MNDKQESDYYLSDSEDNLNSDEIQELHLEEDDSLTVRNIMTPLIFKVKETEPISAMSDIMIGGRIHRLLVPRDEKVVGIITTLDMFKSHSRPCQLAGIPTLILVFLMDSFYLTAANR